MSYIILMMLILASQKNSQQSGSQFETVPKSVAVNTTITEASGIASSRLNAGHLWVHEDGGKPAQMLLLRSDGTLVKSLVLKEADNIDWEDMAIAKGPDPTLDYLYIADIGDNLKARIDYAVYRFPEPSSSVTIVPSSDKISFNYPDGPHDAEAILVDNNSKDIFIITKSDIPAQIFKLPYPQSLTSINQASHVGNLSYSGVTGAALSTDGKEIIIKTYLALNYYKMNNGKMEEALKKTPVNLTYQLEPQGEAVAFAANNSGFYTLSEKAFSSVVNLYFYKRK